MVACAPSGLCIEHESHTAKTAERGHLSIIGARENKFRTLACGHPGEGAVLENAAQSAQKVIVMDFGAQYGQLIARRVRDLSVYSELVPCDATAEEVRALSPSAIILSGGPASVYAEDAPSLDAGILELSM